MVDCSVSAWLAMRVLLFSWVLFVPICSILLAGEVVVGSVQCLGDQRALLLQLKNSLTFNANMSTKLVQWDQNLDCCYWDGVTCDDEGHVKSLDLSTESISGGVENSTLFNLGYLQSLDLSYNNFNSTIPARIGNLTTLTYLNLSNAGFWGQIPREISQLTKLVTLDISSLYVLRISSLKLENPNLRMLVQKLSKLENLYLDGVNISAQGIEWCRALSSSLPSLQVLSLANCYLSGPIDSSLEKLRSLSVIRLDFNDLYSLVPEFLSSFSNLTSLSLSSCELNGSFPQKIFQVPTLQNIDISFNKPLEGSLPEFPQHSALQTLVLSSTNFTGSLPSSIGKLWNLSRLELYSCQFNGTLPSSMEQLTQLVYVDLSFNTFIGPVPTFKMSKNLTQILLSHNSLAGAITLGHWEGLNKLVVLDLSNNLLNGSIPASLFALPSLEQIQLSGNQFNGQLPQLPNLSTSVLDFLDLSSNNIEGPIPMSIYNLKNLGFLSLSSNKFNGTVQLDLVQGFRNLATLDLSYNNLTVTASGNESNWPSFTKIITLKLASCNLVAFPNLRNQSKLVHLDLSDNQILEEVPYWIWELGNRSLLYLNLSHNNLLGLQEPYSIHPTLSVLDLHYNQLQGKFPTLPPTATFIDLSNNNFTSPIPANIVAYLNYTVYFSISNNSLTGDIPESICNAGNLRVLDLSDNGLSNIIPSCVLAMSQTLGVLNLRQNNFSGQIPDVFPLNCALETLDLNGNLIQGQLPKSLANCMRLEVLDLGNNMLTGSFPCMLKHISTLRVLVMRSNRFQGSIRCHNTTGVWAKLQIIDLARNNFSGEIPGQFLEKWKAMKDDNDDAHQKIKHIQFSFLKLSPSGYYQDAVTVTFKGLEIKLQKILSIFTSVDLSCNNFVGPIPQEVGQLGALHALNLSHNALTGAIPVSTGNLRQLESLDLSNNFLSGQIPASLASLNFLSFLNLSFNHLVGQIPSGNQLQTFSADSFTDNEGLCGFPLAEKCSSAGKSTNNIETKFATGIDWNIISAGIGFIVGFGCVVGPLVFCRRFRRWYYLRADDIAFRTFPRIYQRFL